MKNILLKLTIIIVTLFVIAGCEVRERELKREVHTKEWRDAQTPDHILSLLKEGNSAFVQGTWQHWDFLYEQQQTSSGQHPMAVVLSCIDSRAPAETIFNKGIGDIFNARIAGNFVNVDIAGSLEYSCKVAGSKVLLVMGHSDCGAVKAACDHVELGNITEMLSKITPAVDSVSMDTEDRSSKNKSFVKKVTQANVELTIENIRTMSPILKEMEDNKEILIVGCIYDIHTGKVEFL